MLNSKRLWKKVRNLLLCCVAFSLLISPVSALPFSPLSATVVPAAPAPTLEETQAVSAGHQVSKVHRYGYAGSMVIGCLENNTPLTVLGSSGSYYKIDCYDMVGYIAKSQVAVDKAGQYYVNCQASSSDTKTLSSFSVQKTLSLRGRVRELAIAQEGVRYVSGGTTPRGFDCSGFTQYVYRNTGISIQRHEDYQVQDGIIVARKDLQCGDLVFFSNTTGYGHFISHVGIYIGNGQLIHAGSNGIAIVDLDSAYFSSHYQCARRIILSDLNPTVSIPVTGTVQNTATNSYWRSSAQSNS